MPNVNQSFFRQVRGALAMMCLAAMPILPQSGFSQEAVPTAAAIQQSQDRPVPPWFDTRARFPPAPESSSS